ncbi:MAG: hypothetical protein ACPGOY_02350 [Rhodospirillaceae bacterium]
MASYKAVMFDSMTGAQNTYTFETDVDLIKDPRTKLIEAFMDYVDHVELPKEDVGYEIQTALKNREAGVVTAVGEMNLAHGSIPFMVMISKD